MDGREAPPGSDTGPPTAAGPWQNTVTSEHGEPGEPGPGGDGWRDIIDLTRALADPAVVADAEPARQISTRRTSGEFTTYLFSGDEAREAAARFMDAIARITPTAHPTWR